MHGRGNSRRKVRGASLLSDGAWVSIGLTLGLSKRELQIVQSVFDNLPETGIAKRFGISGHTVHTHLNRVFKKLDVTTRTELVLRIMEQMIGLTFFETGVLPPMCCYHHSGGCCLHNSVPGHAKSKNVNSVVPATTASRVGQIAD